MQDRQRTLLWTSPENKQKLDAFNKECELSGYTKQSPLINIQPDPINRESLSPIINFKSESIIELKSDSREIISKKVPKLTRKRVQITNHHLKELNSVFEKNEFPNKATRILLAKKLDLSPRSIQIWFQNKRQIKKNQNRL